MERELVSRYVREKLKQPDTYVTAVVVGTFINAYGHALVPWLRGEPDVVGRFLGEFNDSPGLTTLSVVLGYAFPLLVGTWASVRTRWAMRRSESRAEFPDAKPDPVFRAAPDGAIVDVGESTLAQFERHGVARAQDIVGSAVWDQLVVAVREGASDESAATVYFEPEGRWYLVGYAPGSAGTLNVYLTRVPAELVAPIGAQGGSA